LLLLAVSVSWLEGLLRRWGGARAWCEVALVGLVAYVAYDVGAVASQPVPHAFTAKMATTPESTGPFHTQIHLPPELNYTVDYVCSSLTAEIANIGTIDCSTFPGLNQFVRDEQGRCRGLGARGAEDPLYKGEAYVADGVGKASIEKWTPNEVTVAVHGAQAGEHVVLNQNWDPGWSADGSPAINRDDQVSAPIHDRDSRIVFRYRPRTWWPGVAIFILTVGGLVAARRAMRRARAFAARRVSVDASP
jgi:hypothetical protein